MIYLKKKWMPEFNPYYWKSLQKQLVLIWDVFQQIWQASVYKVLQPHCWNNLVKLVSLKFTAIVKQIRYHIKKTTKYVKDREIITTLPLLFTKHSPLNQLSPTKHSPLNQLSPISTLPLLFTKQSHLNQ